MNFREMLEERLKQTKQEQLEKVEEMKRLMRKHEQKLKADKEKEGEAQ